MIDDILTDLQESGEKTLVAMKRDLNKVRTGRANLSLLDDIRVDYYGTPTPLNQVAALTVADPRLITIRPWEKPMIPLVEKAVNQADLGLNPSNDGELIRLPIPPLSGDRRKELVRQVKRYGEEAKVSLRSHRRDANSMLKDLKADGDISEDECERSLKRVQDVTDAGTKSVDELVAAKETEVLSV